MERAGCPLERGRQWIDVLVSYRWVTIRNLHFPRAQSPLWGKRTLGASRGAVVRIRILPPWWSTWWFRIAWPASSQLRFATWLYQLRTAADGKKVSALRMDERMAERTRIAQGICHDTVLQGLLSVSMAGWRSGKSKVAGFGCR